METIIAHPRVLFPEFVCTCVFIAFYCVCVAEGLGVALSRHLFGVSEGSPRGSRLHPRGPWAARSAAGCPVRVCCHVPGVPVCARWPGWRGRVWGGGNYWDGPALMSVISLHSHRL